jgi:hypothetical protein
MNNLFKSFSNLFQNNSLSAKMIVFENSTGKCWWCNNIADTREHVYKRSDLEREYKNDNQIVLIHNEEPFRNGEKLQSVNSQFIKFKKSLCNNCNSSKSQPFDRAYDKFVTYLKTSEEKCYENSIVLFNDIYKADWEIEKYNLIKYFIKHLGCSLAETNIRISKNLIEFLNGKGDPKCLEIVFSQSIDRKNYLDSLKNEDFRASWIGRSQVLLEFNKKSMTINFFKYELYYRSFSFYINWDHKIEGFKNNFQGDSIRLIHYQEDYFRGLINEKK